MNEEKNIVNIGLFEPIIPFITNFRIEKLPNDHYGNPRVNSNLYEYWITFNLPTNLMLDRNVLDVYFDEYDPPLMSRSGKVEFTGRIKKGIAPLVYGMVIQQRPECKL
jgi:hypothetical protein